MNEPLFIYALDTAAIKKNGLIVEEEQFIDLSTVEFYVSDNGIVLFDLKNLTRKALDVQTFLSKERDGYLENMFKCNFSLTSKNKDALALIKSCYYNECEEVIEFFEHVPNSITQYGDEFCISMHPFSTEQNCLVVQSVYSRQSLCVEWKDHIASDKMLIKERLRGISLKFSNCLFDIKRFKSWLTEHEEEEFEDAHEIRSKLIYFETFSKLGNGEFSLVSNDQHFKKVLPTSEAKNRCKLIYDGPKKTTKTVCLENVGFTIFVNEEDIEKVKQNLPHLKSIYCDNIIYEYSPVCFKIVAHLEYFSAIQKYLSEESMVIDFTNCEIFADVELTEHELEQERKKEWKDARLKLNLWRFLNGE